MKLRLRRDQCGLYAAHRVGRESGEPTASQKRRRFDVRVIALSAVRDGDDYSLNGSTYWITNAGLGQLHPCRNDRPPMRGPTDTCFLSRRVPRRFPKYEDKMDSWLTDRRGGLQWTCVFPATHASA